MRATPDFDFQLGESAEMIRETVGRFADEQIAPLADRIEWTEIDAAPDGDTFLALGYGPI